MTDRGLESISGVGNDDPPSAAPVGYTGSKLSETVGLNTLASDADSEGSNLESIPC